MVPKIQFGTRIVLVFGECQPVFLGTRALKIVPNWHHKLPADNPVSDRISNDQPIEATFLQVGADASGRRRPWVKWLRSGPVKLWRKKGGECTVS